MRAPSGDALERLSAGGLVPVSRRAATRILEPMRRRTQLMRASATNGGASPRCRRAAFHAHPQHDHRLRASRDVRDLDGAGGRFLADRDGLQILGGSRLATIRRRCHDTERARRTHAPCGAQPQSRRRGTDLSQPDIRTHHQCCPSGFQRARSSPRPRAVTQGTFPFPPGARCAYFIRGTAARSRQAAHSGRS